MLTGGSSVRTPEEAWCWWVFFYTGAVAEVGRLEELLQPYFKELGQPSPSLFAFLELAAGRAPIPGLIPAGPEQLALWRLHRRRTRVIFRSPSAITLRSWAEDDLPGSVLSAAGNAGQPKSLGSVRK